jgi:ferredoxin, 2Fe-2S
MPTVIYFQHDGTKHDIDLANGNSVMEGALEHMIPGIDADCGGQCICATCHLYVDTEWLAKLDPPSAKELEMLNFVEATQSNSRLSCQIKMRDDLEGLIVRLPEGQH